MILTLNPFVGFLDKFLNQLCHPENPLKTHDITHIFFKNVNIFQNYQFPY